MFIRLHRLRRGSSTAAEETGERDRKRTCRSASSGAWRSARSSSCAVVGWVRDRGSRCPAQELSPPADPLARALQGGGLWPVGWVVSAGAVVARSPRCCSVAGRPARIFMAMARDGLLRSGPRRSTRSTAPPTSPAPSSPAASSGLGALIADENEISTSPTSARSPHFIVFSGCWCCASWSRSVRGLPGADGGRRSLLGAAACVYVMKGLPLHAWERFGIWLVIGLVLYFGYGMRHSRLRVQKTVHNRLEGVADRKSPG